MQDLQPQPESGTPSQPGEASFTYGDPAKTGNQDAPQPPGAGYTYGDAPLVKSDDSSQPIATSGPESEEAPSGPPAPA